MISVQYHTVRIINHIIYIIIITECLLDIAALLQKTPFAPLNILRAHNTTNPHSSSKTFHPWRKCIMLLRLFLGRHQPMHDTPKEPPDDRRTRTFGRCDDTDKSFQHPIDDGIDITRMA